MRKFVAAWKSDELHNVNEVDVHSELTSARIDGAVRSSLAQPVRHFALFWQADQIGRLDAVKSNYRFDGSV